MEAARNQQGRRQRSILCRPVILAILIMEAAERVAYFGFRAVLVLYFTEIGYTESIAVSLCAAVAGLAYASPLLGAIMADSVWGRFLTISRFGSSYAVGLAAVTAAAYGLQYDKSIMIVRSFTFIGLFMVCIGTGGIKPCVSAFGADQVVLSGNFSYEASDHRDDDDLSTDNSNTKSADKTNGFQDDSEQISCTIEDEISPDRRDASSLNGQSRNPFPQQTGEAEAIREFFNTFYVAINVGALLAFTFIPVVRANYGFGAAFLLPCLSMFLSLSVFMSKRRSYKHRKVGDHTDYRMNVQNDSDLSHEDGDREQSPSLLQIFQACVVLLKRRVVGSLSRAGVHTLISTAAEDEDNNTADTRNDQNSVQQLIYDTAARILHILPILGFYPIFWMLYDQQASVWTLQATRLNLHGLEPEQLQLLNPLEIMVFVPCFDKIIYPWLERKGVNIEPLRRMEVGMVLTSLSFLTCAWLQRRIETEEDNTVSVAWQIPQITIITVAEILLNVTGLEFAYSQAPPSMQTLVLAIYLLMTAIGDGLASILFATIFSHLTTSATMIVCALCMLINLFLFCRVSRRWRPFEGLNADSSGATAGIDDREIELRRIHDNNIT